MDWLRQWRDPSRRRGYWLRYDWLWRGHDCWELLPDFQRYQWKVVPPGETCLVLLGGSSTGCD
jgi:hypothetical protein